MQVDYIIVGQGLCGTFLSWYLDQCNKTYIIIDENKPFTASKVSSGIINPITGRRFVKTWMIDDILPFVVKAYTEIEQILDIPCITSKNVIHFFVNKESKDIFIHRLQEEKKYLIDNPSKYLWNNIFNYEYAYGEITSCYLINSRNLIQAYRKKLLSQHTLLAERFNVANLQVTDYSVTYKDVVAKKIIFCDGTDGANISYFKKLPYALNKGEFLLVQMPNFPSTHIFKKANLTIVPWQGDILWVGTTYEWNYDDDKPTQIFKEKVISQLHSFLKIPFNIIDHKSAIRSATLERRPFVGIHPHLSTIGILNGMGTKGCSLAPYFAYELAQYLCYSKPITAEANMNRFHKLLSQ